MTDSPRAHQAPARPVWVVRHPTEHDRYLAASGVWVPVVDAARFTFRRAAHIFARTFPAAAGSDVVVFEDLVDGEVTPARRTRAPSRRRPDVDTAEPTDR